MIAINNATKRFEEKVAVSSLTVAFDAGITGLVGQNGAGKSTLLRMIAGVYNVDEGEILVGPYHPTSKESKELVFFLPDTPYYPNNIGIKGLYDFYNMFYNINKEQFFELVKKFNLPLDRKISKFSKGMKRLAFVALALSVDCKILLLDEAFDGLDILVLETVKETIVKLCKNEDKTVVISSHNVLALEKLVDRFVLIRDGKLSNEGDLDELGETFVKYQAIFNDTVCNEKILTGFGLKVVSYRQIGSIHNIVINKRNDEDVEAVLRKLEPNLLEEVAIDSSEIILLQMALANKEAKYEKD